MISDTKTRRMAPLETPTDLNPNAVRDISGALNILLADMFALYLRRKISTGTYPDRISEIIISSWTSMEIRSLPQPTRSRNAFARLVV